MSAMSIPLQTRDLGGAMWTETVQRISQALKSRAIEDSAQPETETAGPLEKGEAVDERTFSEMRRTAVCGMDVQEAGSEGPGRCCYRNPGVMRPGARDT